MGGEWGVGASLAMEVGPREMARNSFRAFLQEGYALGNLLAAVAFWTVFPHWGWRPMFFIGGLPALLTLFIRLKVKGERRVEGARRRREKLERLFPRRRGQLEAVRLSGRSDGHA